MSLLSGYAWCTGKTGKVRSTWNRAEYIRECVNSKRRKSDFQSGQNMKYGDKFFLDISCIFWEGKELNLTTGKFRKNKGRVPSSSQSSKTPVQSRNEASHLLWERLKLVFWIHVLPDALHVIPVLYYAVFHRVSDWEKTSVLLSKQKGQCSLPVSDWNNSLLSITTTNSSERLAYYQLHWKASYLECTGQRLNTNHKHLFQRSIYKD